MYRIRRFFRRIHNLYRWFPIIWRDQDWDTHYIWEILKFKLKNQSEYIGYHDRHMSAKRDAEIMMLCVRLINKIQDEYYEMEYMDYEDTKFEFKPSDRCVDCNELEIITVRDNLNDYFKKYPLIHKKVLKEKEVESKRGLALNIGYINHKRARKLLFNILENNIESWWD